MLIKNSSGHVEILEKNLVVSFQNHILQFDSLYSISKLHEIDDADELIKAIPKFVSLLEPLLKSRKDVCELIKIRGIYEVRRFN